MAKKDKQTIQLIDGVDPGLFGQNIPAGTIAMRSLGERTSSTVLFLHR